MTITETHLFFFFKSSSIWQAKIFCDYGISTDIFTHTVEHTQFLWVLGTIQMVAWSKKGRARAKQKGKAEARTLLAKLQLKQYHWQRQGKMGNYGRGKKKINPPHTGEWSALWLGRGLRAALGRVLCQSCWVGTNFWFQIRYCLLRIYFVTG